MTSKQNLIFASPGQEIQGTADYTYAYTPQTFQDFGPFVFNQIVYGIPKNKPTCIDVGQLFNKK